MASILSKRLEKLRVQFLFDHPFLSVLALSLPLHYIGNPHEVFETNGKEIFVDAFKAEHINDENLKYMYAHILLHILLKHAFRMGERDAKSWNRSCDIVINLLLADFERVGVVPADEVILEKFKDKSVEEVYQALHQESHEGEGTPDEENPNEQKQDLIENEGDTQSAQEELDNLIVQAIGAAQKQGNVSVSFLEAINEVTKPKIDLQTLLHVYLCESYFDKVSDFSRPNRRFIHQGLYLPGYSKETNRLQLYIALDRSMSISYEVFSKFLGIIDATLRMSSDFEVTVIPFDEAVDESAIMSYDAQSLGLPKLSFEKGNGGTDYYCILEYFKKKALYEGTLMVLSDGFFKIEHATELQTLFLVSEKKNMKRLEKYGDVFYFDL